MKIETFGQEAVICVVAIADEPGDDGKFFAEFYPVYPLLKLRDRAEMLIGHPFLDLKPADGEGDPPMVVEFLRPGQVRRIERMRTLNKFVALKIQGRRPTKTSRSRQWQRAQRASFPAQPPKPKKERINFFFVKGADYLNQAEEHWLKTICVGGRLYHDQLQAAQAFGQLARGLGRAVADEVERSPEPRAKRKTRRLLESGGN